MHNSAVRVHLTHGASHKHCASAPQTAHFGMHDMMAWQMYYSTVQNSTVLYCSIAARPSHGNPSPRRAT